jgi:alpha-amylase
VLNHRMGTTNEHGWGEFRCNGGSVSVWIQD